jgi:hypothetical protein
MKIFLGAAAGFALAAALSGPAFAAADLVPVVTNLAAGEAAVINIGDAASAAGHMTVNCEQTAGVGGCPEDPVGMVPYENAMFPNRAVMEVPALGPGESYSHQMAFFAGLVWAPGTYELTLEVDAGDATAEVNEANNETAVDKVQLMGNGVAPIPKGPGKLTIGGQSGDGKKKKQVQLQTQALVAGLPDLIATSIGLVSGAGPAPWGSTVVIDQPQQVQKMKVGPGKQYCLVSPTAFRTHNKGKFAAGAFVNRVYREADVVHTQPIPALAANSFIDFAPFALQVHEGLNIIRVAIDEDKQVSESDEKNTFAVKLDVKLDCNGDGKTPR